MLYPTLTEVQELLEEYDVVPVFYEVLSDSMTPIHIFNALKEQSDTCFKMCIRDSDKPVPFYFPHIYNSGSLADSLAGTVAPPSGLDNHEDICKIVLLQDYLRRQNACFVIAVGLAPLFPRAHPPSLQESHCGRCWTLVHCIREAPRPPAETALPAGPP